MTVDNSLKDLNSLKLTVEQSVVEKFTEGSERPCDRSDFLKTQKTREELTTEIKVFIDNFANSHLIHGENGECETTRNCPDVENKLLALLIVVCGQNVTLHPWNTEGTVKNCEEILAKLLQLFNCKDTPELISRNNKINLTRDILQILCSDLTSAQWKHFPASVACYKWILEMIKQPDLSHYLQFVLPPALLLTDDFVNENRIMGTQCLNHIVQNITIAELQLYHHGDVIYNALLPILRIREAALIQAAIIPLVSVTTKLEFNLGNKDVTKWSKYDDILEIFLESMELEQIIDLRNCYISNLEFLINALECRITRWSKRLLRIFDEYIQTAGKYNDEKTTNQCLRAIEKFMEFSSEVTPVHAKHLLFTLLIALHSTGSSNSELQIESKNLALKCINTVLRSLSETEKGKLKQDFKEKLNSNDNFHGFYEQILNIFESNK